MLLFIVMYREQKTTIALQPVEKLNIAQEHNKEINSPKATSQQNTHETGQTLNETNSELQVAYHKCFIYISINCKKIRPISKIMKHL